MSENSSNNKCIAKNTFLLYSRMLFMMAVSFYTSRVVLATLGVEDFGIYNVVGGIVVMFSFINSAMSLSTQRYLTFELGRGDSSLLQKVFTTSIYIHGVISFLVVLLAETLGLWFLCNKMNIPIERMDTAMWVFQMSVLATVVMIMSVPYNATIIAHEKMKAFAYISVLEVVLKLSVVYLLQVGNIDKLQLYSVLIFLVQLLIRYIYGRYCGKHFKESRILKIFDVKLFKELICFAGWNLWDFFSYVTYTQGINIILNIYFGPTINAARGLAVQMHDAVGRFTSNFQTAINPQIIKSYASQDYCYLHKLIFQGSRMSFFLTFIVVLPTILETHTILSLWLTEVPAYTVPFLQIMLCTSIISAMSNILNVSALATGKIRKYQSITGIILLGILPVSYFALEKGSSPIAVFIVQFGLFLIALICRLLIIKPMIKLSIRKYAYDVVIPCLKVCFLSIIFPIVLKNILPTNLPSACIIICISILCVLTFTYCCGLSADERRVFKRLCKKNKVMQK